MFQTALLMIILAAQTLAEVDAIVPENHAATVLVFVSTDCPIANASAPELNRIATDFSEADVAFFRVYVDSRVMEADIIAHGEDYGYSFPGIRDEQQVLVRRSGATRVPEAAVFNRSGALVYRGRINNAFADYGKRRRHVTEHNLRDAITAVLADKAVENPRTSALGCFIKLVETDESVARRAEEESNEDLPAEN